VRSIRREPLTAKHVRSLVDVLPGGHLEGLEEVEHAGAEVSVMPVEGRAVVGFSPLLRWQVAANTGLITLSRSTARAALAPMPVGSDGRIRSYQPTAWREIPSRYSRNRQVFNVVFLVCPERLQRNRGSGIAPPKKLLLPASGGASARRLSH
jgi:hypothetical protein